MEREKGEQADTCPGEREQYWEAECLPGNYPQVKVIMEANEKKDRNIHINVHPEDFITRLSGLHSLVLLFG